MGIRKRVFIIPLVLLLITIFFSLADSAKFLFYTQKANAWILLHFGWLYSYTALGTLLALVAVYISPIGSLIIGGKSAKPQLSKRNWFSIALCTTIAAGILFWATAEPLYHFHKPPGGIAVKAGSTEAENFALSTLFLHWTFIPYSIYTLTALMFALSYFNLKQPFQIGSQLSHILGSKNAQKISPAIDSISLFCLVAGMAASIGSGLITLTGGFASHSSLDITPALTGVITIMLTGTFIWSAVSGLNKGIKLLSNINIIGFLILIIWVIYFGPFGDILPKIFPAVSEHVTTFLPRSLSSGIEKSWTETWTIFYWANWMAWTPVTAIFLGRLGKGYSVRTFIRFNLLYPALFSMGWMALFGSYSLHYDQASGNALYSLLTSKGPETIIFGVLNQMPLPVWWGIFYFMLVFISMVTSGDSNISAMSSLSTIGITYENEEAPYQIKIIWGLIIGLTAWIMITLAGLDGVRMTSNLGGFPALIILVLILSGTIKLLINGRKSELFENQND